MFTLLWDEKQHEVSNRRVINIINATVMCDQILNTGKGKPDDPKLYRFHEAADAAEIFNTTTW